jgi:hypothetical protein
MGESPTQALAGEARKASRNRAEFMDNPVDCGNDLRIGPPKSACLENSTTAVLSIAAKDLLFVAIAPRQVYSAGRAFAFASCARAALGTVPVQRWNARVNALISA